MDRIYKVPSTPSSAAKGSVPSEESEASFISMVSAAKGEVYDVPNQAIRASLFTAATTPRNMPRTSSLLPISELEKRFDSLESPRCSGLRDTFVYAVPPPSHQDPNYDIPVPSVTGSPQKTIVGYSTLPNPRKPDWIYDVPVGHEKQSPPKSSCDTLPSKAVYRQLCDTPPTHALPIHRGSPASSLYDIPKPCTESPPKVLPRQLTYNKPPAQRLTEDIYSVPPKGEPQTRVIIDPPKDHIPLECRGDLNSAQELKRVRLQRMRNFLACTAFQDLPGNAKLVIQDEEQSSVLCLSAAESQRISTASSSSTSSCDSLALSSSSPEPLREVTLSQDEACRRLLELKDCVCKAVPCLMDFVSSHWRSREHLEKHLKAIKEASEGIATSLACFLNFALNIKGNARRLTDSNLQTRLYKQLSIIEDSSVILQQTVRDLNTAGWPLNSLCQDPGQAQSPDQLERFVMVARTVPEDVKRLVSIVNANGKLLFRVPQKEPECPKVQSQQEAQKSPDVSEQQDLVEDDDYVELQTKTDFENQQKEVKTAAKYNNTPASKTTHANKKRHSSESSSGSEENQPPSLSEHCRLYFGALQKAIRGFVGSLLDNQPPEKFISQGKLVIMVGQRLVDTLCREAQRGESREILLSRSNHLCALLKQLAVATKKAALHFPDKQALQEAQEFANELAQRAQHFRISLDL